MCGVFGFILAQGSEVSQKSIHSILNNFFKLSDVQAKSILEIRLSRLTNLERSKLAEDLYECVKMIEDYLEILSSSKRLNSVLTDELNEINSKINSPRLSFKRSSTSLVLFSFTLDTFLLKSLQNWSKTFTQFSLPEVISSN